MTRIGRWPYTRYWYLHRSRIRWPRYFLTQLIEPAIVLFSLLTMAAGIGVATS